MRRVVEVFQYDQSKLDIAMLNKIRSVKTQEKESYRKLFFEELPEALNFKPQGSFELSLEKLCASALSVQTVGNCGWASSEASVFVFFALNTLLNSDLSDIDGELANVIKNKFNTWLSFTQTFQLELYLGQHVMRPTSEKAESRRERRKNVNIDFPVLLSSIKAILSTASKISNPEETFNVIKTLLAKTLSLKSSSSEELHLKTAQAILDSIGTITPEELKVKFEQVL